MVFQMSFEGASKSFACRDDQTVLGAMSAAGGRYVLVGCRGGGCGVCRVSILSGQYETGAMSAAHVSEAERSQGIALACQVYPRADLRLRALGRKGAPPASDALGRLMAAYGSAREAAR